MEQSLFEIQNSQLLLLICALLVILSVAGLLAGTFGFSDDFQNDADTTDNAIRLQLNTIDEGFQKRLKVIEATCEWIRQRLMDTGLKQEIIDNGIALLHNIDVKATATAKDTMDDLTISREIKNDIETLAGDVQGIKCDMAETSTGMPRSQSGTNTELFDKLTEMIQTSTARIIEANKSNVDGKLDTITSGYCVLQEEVRMLRAQLASDKTCSTVTEEMMKSSVKEVIKATRDIVLEELVPLSREMEAMNSKQAELVKSQLELKAAMNGKLAIFSSNAFHVNLANWLSEMGDKVSRQVLEAIKLAQVEKETCSAKDLVQQPPGTGSIVGIEQSSATVPLSEPVSTQPSVAASIAESLVKEEGLERDKASKKHDQKTSEKLWADEVEEDISKDIEPDTLNVLDLTVSSHTTTGVKPVGTSDEVIHQAADSTLKKLEKIKSYTKKTFKRCHKCDEDILAAEHNSHHNKCRKRRCNNCGDMFDQADLVRRHNKVCPRKDGSKDLQPAKASPQYQQAPLNAPKGPRQKSETDSHPSALREHSSTPETHSPVGGNRWTDQGNKMPAFATKGGSMGIGGSKYAS